MLPDDIKQILNSKLFPEVLPIGHDEAGDVLGVTDLHVELRSGPDPEVEEDAVVELVEQLGLLAGGGQLYEQLGSHQHIDIDQLSVNILEERSDDGHTTASHQKRVPS